jgi:hypothetical protein
MYDKGCFHTFIWWGRAHRDPLHPRYGPTQIKDLGVLRQAEVELTHGKRIARSAAVWASPNRVTAAADAKRSSQLTASS